MKYTLIREWALHSNRYAMIELHLPGLSSPVQVEVCNGPVLEEQGRVTGRLPDVPRAWGITSWEVWHHGHSTLFGEDHPILDVFAPYVPDEYGTHRRIPAEIQSVLLEVGETLAPQDEISKLRRAAERAKDSVPEGTRAESWRPYVEAAIAYWDAMEGAAFGRDDLQAATKATSERMAFVVDLERLPLHGPPGP